MATLVAAAAHLDSARHKLGAHLSDVRSKRRLRALLLNHTTQSEKRARYRALTGSAAAYAAFCDKFGLPYADQARADGISLLVCPVRPSWVHSEPTSVKYSSSVTSHGGSGEY